MRIAAITDIHGNLPALEAVLADARASGADLIVQLGDALSGPLWPRETAQLLRSLALDCVRGNHDRALATTDPSMTAGDRFALSELDAADLEWLRGWPMTHRCGDDVLLFHATPDSDDVYLLEDSSSGDARLRGDSEIAARLANWEAKLMLCGHTHLPRILRLADGRTIVNAGSVGLQAFVARSGGEHRHENGSPHARYAIVDIEGARIDARIVAVEYDWDAASERAAANGSPTWAAWLASGRS